MATAAASAVTQAVLETKFDHHYHEPRLRVKNDVRTMKAYADMYKRGELTEDEFREKLRIRTTVYNWDDNELTNYYHDVQKDVEFPNLVLPKKLNAVHLLCGVVGVGIGVVIGWLIGNKK